MPRILNGVSLSDGQLKWLDNIAQALMQEGYSESSAWAIAVSRFKERYKKDSDSWVLKD